MTLEARTLRIIAEGRVQGVGFRVFAQREAERLRVSGWVRNRWDGTVEVVVTGPPAAVDEFVEAARRGPVLATVEALRLEDADPEALQAFGGGKGLMVLPTA